MLSYSVSFSDRACSERGVKDYNESATVSTRLQESSSLFFVYVRVDYLGVVGMHLLYLMMQCYDSRWNDDVAQGVSLYVVVRAFYLREVRVRAICNCRVCVMHNKVYMLCLSMTEQEVDL